MLKEYALQPSVVSSWTRCRFLMDKFGYGRGRVISRYPKKWTKMAYESLSSLDPVEKKRIEEGLIRLKKALYPRYYEWDPDQTWLANAIDEHRQRPFCAIITENACGQAPGTIREEDLDEEEEPRWKAEVQRHIERTATEMAACAEALLRNAKHILFVDPYFDPTARRFRRPLESFIYAAVSRDSSIPIERIEIHTGDLAAGTKEHFDHGCQTYLPRHIPTGLKVRVVRWDQSYLHNRFVLTERGGLIYSTGLDDHNEGTRLHDIVDLLASGPHAQTWGEYQRDNPAFPLKEDDLVIEGAATWT